MTIRLGLTVINIEVDRDMRRSIGRQGPDQLGQSTVRIFWCWPVSVLILTDRR